MKRLFVLLFSVVLMAVSHQSARSQALIMLLFGDELSSENFVGGINAGLGISTYSAPPDAAGRLDWSLGAFLEWKLSDNVFIGSDITFKNPSGARNLDGLWSDVPEIDSILFDPEERRITSYVTLPVILKYQLGSFRVFGGPQVGYLVAATDNIAGTGPNGADIDASRSAFSKLNRWDAGVVVGLETLLSPNLGINSLRLGIRYYQGLVDVTKDESVSSLNSGIYFTVGIPMGAPKDIEDELKE